MDETTPAPEVGGKSGICKDCKKPLDDHDWLKNLPMCVKPKPPDPAIAADLEY